MAPIAVGLHFKQYRALAATHPIERYFGSSANGQHVHTVNLLAGDSVPGTAAVKLACR